MESDLNKNKVVYFLRFFTYNLIKAKYFEQKKQEELEKEELRIKQEIEIQKLRKRFSQYLDKISEEDLEKENFQRYLYIPPQLSLNQSSQQKQNFQQNQGHQQNQDPHKNQNLQQNKTQEALERLNQRNLHSGYLKSIRRLGPLNIMTPMSGSRNRIQNLRNSVIKKQINSFNTNNSYNQNSPKQNPQLNSQIENNLPRNSLNQNSLNQQNQTEVQGINFYSITPLIKDVTVTLIECYGPNKNIIIKKIGNTIKTSLVLSSEEIQSIIKSFADRARVPLIEGMLKAKVGDLSISAIISKSTNLSFVIAKKTPYSLIDDSRDILTYKPKDNQRLRTKGKYKALSS